MLGQVPNSAGQALTPGAEIGDTLSGTGARTGAGTGDRATGAGMPGRDLTGDEAMQLDTHKPWPHNAWYHAAWNSEVEAGAKPLARTLLNEDVVIYRDAQGAAHVLEDRCCHRATPLRLGEVVENGIQCGYHGLIFDGDGKCVHVPGSDVIPSKARVRSYPVVEKNEIIWAWMGDPALADESRVLDFPWNDDHENWPHIHELLEIECNYSLLIDNLMDLTHIPFIHRNTIGGGDQSGQVNATMDVTPTEDRRSLHPVDARYRAAAHLQEGRRLGRRPEVRPLAGFRICRPGDGQAVGPGRSKRVATPMRAATARRAGSISASITA